MCSNDSIEIDFGDDKLMSNSASNETTHNSNHLPCSSTNTNSECSNESISNLNLSKSGDPFSLSLNRKGYNIGHLNI